jgi:hypothetical protein
MKGRYNRFESLRAGSEALINHIRDTVLGLRTPASKDLKSSCLWPVLRGSDWAEFVWGREKRDANFSHTQPISFLGLARG